MQGTNIKTQIKTTSYVSQGGLLGEKLRLESLIEARTDVLKVFEDERGIRDQFHEALENSYSA